jgi:hypothetical protein
MKPRTPAVLAFLAVLGCTTAATSARAAGAEEQRPFRFRCGVAGALALWIAPSDYALELAADCGLRWPIFSIAVELRGALPAGARLPLYPPPGVTAPPGTTLPLVPISTSRFAGAVVPCVQWELSERLQKPTLLGCALVQGGAMFATSDQPGLVNIDDRSPASVLTKPYFAAGARVAFEIDILSDRLSLRLAADYLGVPGRPVFTIDDRYLYQPAPFSMAIGGGLGVFF